jgi:hypothetical protein
LSNSKSDQIKSGKIHGWYVYVIAESGVSKACKVGRARDVACRRATLQTGNPRKLVIVQKWHLDTREMAVNVERSVLRFYDGIRLVRSEWIEQPPSAVVGTVNSMIYGLEAVVRESADPKWERA